MVPPRPHRGGVRPTALAWEEMEEEVQVAQAICRRRGATREEEQVLVERGAAGWATAATREGLEGMRVEANGRAVQPSEHVQDLQEAAAGETEGKRKHPARSQHCRKPCKRPWGMRR